MDIFEKCFNFNKVEELKKENLYPYFHTLNSSQDTVVLMEGKRTVMLGSNNYLGLTVEESVKESGINAIKKYGTGCSGSRFLNGTLDTHVQLEKELAEFLDKEDVVTFSTGFQSNLGIISSIIGMHDYVICDKENHASIYDGCKLSYGKMIRYEHSDMEDLESKLKTLDLLNHGALIVTDGVFSMGGDIAKLPEIVKIAKKYGARVMVDDAHALGVLGKRGRGTAEYFDLEKEVDIYMGTFSKSLASLGGYMASTKKVCEFVRHSSRPFIFSASITPSSVAVARESLKIIKEHPERKERLLEVSSYMRNKLKAYGVKIIESNTPIIPIYVYEDEKAFLACKLLLERGVYVNPVVSPATPKGKALLRTSYTATHKFEDLDYASKQIYEVLKQIEVI
ncbi:MAG: pyridoxal phosphate-dependent aminotransferase family protein [Firmicutes bacterium]|nr:pyridoxal phosphate-dependent aminotransferase family protein [Candidatus Caballimonas caccae]